MMGEGFRKPPVEVDEEIDVKIEALGGKGDGIAKKDGFVLFVPGVKEGDEVRVKVTKVLRKVAFAEVVGSAQGKVEAPAAAPAEAPAEEAPASAEDSEDFGEEPAAKEASEEEKKE
jgi:predicted RNA-binding protein with TRAM domain